MTRPLRRTARALLAATAALAVGLTLAPAAPAAPGDSWLAGEMTDGLIVNEQFDFPDYGLSIDAALALRESRGRRSEVRATYRAVAADVESYTGAGTERYAGALAKTAAFARAVGRDPSDVGGVDVLARLRQRVSSTAPYVGRIEDSSEFGDYANVIGQAYAVRALQGLRRGLGKKAARFLLAQQCRRGFFRLNFAPKDQAGQACGQGPSAQSSPDTDATALVVLALADVPRQTRAVRRSIARALDWLVRTQRRGGAWGGGVATEGANTNSTGLASWVLGDAGRCRPARRGAAWVARLQVGREPGTPLAGERGAIAYDRTALQTAQREGITDRTSDQWRRATSQALPALVYRGGC